MSALLQALLAPAAIHAPAPRDAASVRTFLLGIYRHYEDKDGSGVPLDKPDRWYEPVLAGAMAKDYAESDKSGDMPKMDADPFCYCQDFIGLKGTRVEAVTITGDRATASVTFDFGGGEMTVGYILVWTRKGWRIWDQTYPEGGSTRAMYFPSN